MRSAELSPERPQERAYRPSGNTFRAARSSSIFEQEVAMARRAPKSMVAALIWTLFFGPLGLCYLSGAGGLIAVAASAVVFLAGGMPTLAIIWPAAMVLAILVVLRQRVRRSGRGVRSGASRPDDDRATGNTWFLSNI